MYTAVILDVGACEECCVVAYKANQNDLYTGLMVCNSLGAALDGIYQQPLRFQWYLCSCSYHCEVVCALRVHQ